MLLRSGKLLTWTLPQRHWPDVVVDDICPDRAPSRSCAVEREESRSGGLVDESGEMVLMPARSMEVTVWRALSHNREAWAKRGRKIRGLTSTSYER